MTTTIHDSPASHVHATADGDDVAYDAMLDRIDTRFSATIAAGTPLFATDAEGLFAAYLAAMPAPMRQHHACHACRQFFERFGGLVTIDEAGITTPAVWNLDDVDASLWPSIKAVISLVHRANVTGVFLSSERVWGQPVSKTKARTWRHFAITPPNSLRYKKTVLTAGQAMAEKREDHHTVARALAEFTRPTLETALTLLRTDALYRAEKTLGPATWLAALHDARDAAGGEAKPDPTARQRARHETRQRQKDNLLWRAVATAPAGFCHPRSSMVGTLLEDIAAGMAYDDVAKRFAAKMHPLQYQRPQAAPSAGVLAQAEKLVAELGSAGSLARRFARLDEVETIWTPKPTRAEQVAKPGEVFGHIAPKNTSRHSKGAVKPMAMPPVTMTWAKFRDTVLPTADKIEFFARNLPDSYAALVTAVNADAPPILQWDSLERRNPVSHYFWHGGALPSVFRLAALTWCRVNAITLNPSSWSPHPLAHHGEFALFILDGARDTRMSGNAIFPECLRSEYHGIRAAIEAYSKAAKIEGAEQSSACGIALQKKSSATEAWNQLFRVTTGNAVVEYKLDRWD